MAFDSTPWAVGGGAEHSPEVARLLAYAATGGAHGIITPGDLKVQALAVPGGAVRVAPGGVLVRNGYPGGGQQTYVARNATEDQVAIAPTGSAGGRTDLIVARVVDPQYEGQPPADPTAFQYARAEVIAGVPANADQAWLDANRIFPAEALARVSLPASRATVEAQHITDLRRLAQPCSVRVVEMGGPTPEVRQDTSNGVMWPDFRPTVEVPEWATHVSMIVHLASVGHRDGDAHGTLAVTLGMAGQGQFRSANTFYDVDQPSGGYEGQRHTFTVGGKGRIDDRLRGTVQVLGTEARRDTGPGYLVTVQGTHVVYDVTFEEKAV